MHSFIFHIVFMLFVSNYPRTIRLQLGIYDTISAGTPLTLPLNELRSFLLYRHCSIKSIILIDLQE